MKTLTIVFLVFLVGCTSVSDPSTEQGFPSASASAITSPPSTMEDINTHTHIYGTGADPNIITLGPKEGGQPGWPPYPNKTSMEFELDHGAPVLAPIDMVFIGFSNRNAEYRLNEDGEYFAPYNDLELCFESVSADWPGMIICTYHLYSSPLLPGHNQNSYCAETEKWIGTHQSQGALFFEFDEFNSPDNAIAKPCEAMLGHSVQRGEIIGYAGSVGDHSMAPFRFKVPHETKNSLVRLGDKHLHWVQPGSFFYWKCYNPDQNFPNGVLAYPFECGGYQVPAEQRDINFKYTELGQ